MITYLWLFCGFILSASNLNDLSCSASATLEKNNKIDIATDVYIVLDTYWQYINIYPSLTYLLEGLNVSPVGSNVTLISGKEGKIIVNSTNSPATFQQLYNESVHLLSKYDNMWLENILKNYKSLCFKWIYMNV